MFKKIFNFLVDIIFIAIIIVVVYYFYSSNKNSSLLENGILPYDDMNETIASSKSQNYSMISLEDYQENSSAAPKAPNAALTYYYSQLDDNAKVIYTALQNNINNLKLDNYKIDFSTKFNTLLNTANGMDVLNNSFQSALDAFIYDHPELFYIDLSKISLITKYTTLGSKTTYTVSIAPNNGTNYLTNGFNSFTDVDIAVKQVTEYKNRIISKVNGDTYNKVLVVHDTLVDLLEYDTSIKEKNIYNIYGAFINRKVVCEGYAKAFKYIMDGLNIPCILVSGTATNSSRKTESHMWNYVLINGNWYGVDATWDDPVIIGGNKKSTIRHDYFCKGYYSFSTSHFANGRLSDSGMNFSYPTLCKNNYK